MSTRYDYIKRDAASTHISNLQRVLNEYAAEGWEACGFEPDGDSNSYFKSILFRRPIQTKEGSN